MVTAESEAKFIDMLNGFKYYENQGLKLNKKTKWMILDGVVNIEVKITIEAITGGENEPFLCC